MKTTAAVLQQKCTDQHPIAMLTCYDYPSACLLAEAGVDILLVGDSVGTNVLGYASEREVTIDDMAHHVKAVARGCGDAYLIADLPYRTYETPEKAIATASRLINCGANGIKLEGRHDEIIQALTEAGIEVCAHLGLNPQIHDDFRMQAKTVGSALQLLKDARAVEKNGARLLVLELIPEEVGELVSRALTIPTIGIAAGGKTDGQVLVIHDLLGYTKKALRHVRQYEQFRQRTLTAVAAYVADVRAGQFPAPSQVRHLAPEALAELQAHPASLVQ